MFQNFFFLKSGSAVGLPEKLKLRILNEKYVHATVVTFYKKVWRKAKHFSAVCTYFVFDVDRNRDLHDINYNVPQAVSIFV